MRKKRIKAVSVAVASAISLSLMTGTVLATNAETLSTATTSRYDSIDINSITSEGGNPAEISSSASALAAEKMWYEYITYSPQPVASCRLDDERRLIFYDPYDYTNSMVMEVVGQESDWSSASSIEVSYTRGSSMEMLKGESADVSTSVDVQQGVDVSYGYAEDVSVSTSESWSSTFETSLDVETQTAVSSSVSNGSHQDVEGSIGGKIAGIGVEAKYSNGASHEETSGIEVSTGSSVHTGYSDSKGGSIDFSTTSSVNAGWSVLANRVTSSTGSNVSTSTSWSTEESTTVTRTFDAAYFNESGSPLQWKIVQYEVQMPMKFDLQCLINGEWVTTDSDYCVLTTLQGTCRAWMQNTQAYIEHWGTGEPVTWDAFWSSFFTKESLLAAYQNKLYPSN